MSRVEAQVPIRIEGLGGSFSRNVKIGEHGLGMSYSEPGDIFHLRDVWEDSQGAGTKLAPGTFEFIYFIDRSDSEVVFNRISSYGIWTQVRLGEDGKKEFAVSRVEELLDSGNADNLEIGATDEDGYKVTQVILKKWGYFTHQSQIYSSKMRQLYGKNLNIPTTTIESVFTSLMLPQEKPV